MPIKSAITRMYVIAVNSRSKLTLASQIGARGEGGGGYSFVACLSDSTIDH